MRSGIETNACALSTTKSPTAPKTKRRTGGKQAGSRLYTHSEIDHACLFSMCEQLRGDFLLTYDNADEVRTLALRHGFEARPIAMKNTHHAEMTELLIGRNLRWMEEDS